MPETAKIDINGGAGGSPPADIKGGVGACPHRAQKINLGSLAGLFRLI